jgi:hypothetical protein
MPNKYDIGDLVVISGEFRDPENANALIDPSQVLCDVRDPSGTVTRFTYGLSAGLTKTAVGRYRMLVDVTAAGAWHYRWHSTGAGQAAEERYFYAIPNKAIGGTSSTTTTTSP